MKGLHRVGDTWLFGFTPPAGTAQKCLSFGKCEEAEATAMAWHLISWQAAAKRDFGMACELEIASYLRAEERRGMSDLRGRWRGNVLRQFCSALNAKTPALISGAAISNWYRSDPAKSQKALLAVKEWFQWMCGEGRIQADPFSKWRKGRPGPKKVAHKSRKLAA